MTARPARGPTILVADDDPAIRSNLALFLRAEGYTVREAVDGGEAAEALADPAVAAALLDLKMPKQDGLAVLRGHAERVDEVPVIVVTAYGGSTAAIEAMKLGAYDYVTKPFDLDEVLFTLRRALTQRALVEQVQALSTDPLSNDPDPEEDELVGRSAAMVAVFKAIGLIAGADEPVLILGESGTGKELVANAIHRNSNCAGGPFIKVNCAALSPTLLESELFGHEKGAFTGALARRRGRFEQAHGGTLFLDEVGELGIDLQAKLLRVLQMKTFERVGGEETLSVNVRVVAATNRDLKARVVGGEFREDLYYRLDVVPIMLPPLRERKEDIPLLADYIVRQLSRQHGWPGLALSPDVVEELGRRPWPGNIRELRNVIARAAILARGRVIRTSDLASEDQPGLTALTTPSTTLDLRVALAETEQHIIRQALEQSNWNRTQAARLLGISRRQLFDKIRLYGLHH
ncbi:MAG TPA: sigma-54 dependent transcriptional regulator [Gemmata sp.]|jgi:DNA-binding NtrC family response regulator|nr:sigma-54 dependent transcriptional regulator [Gemmata sp.]